MKQRLTSFFKDEKLTEEMNIKEEFEKVESGGFDLAKEKDKTSIMIPIKVDIKFKNKKLMNKLHYIAKTTKSRRIKNKNIKRLVDVMENETVLIILSSNGRDLIKKCKSLKDFMKIDLINSKVDRLQNE